MFQFTHPGRGATAITPKMTEHEGVSIHAPREGCDVATDVGRIDEVVSIHAPREGCDKTFDPAKAALEEFQFTHPGRGATRYVHP